MFQTFIQSGTGQRLSEQEIQQGQFGENVFFIEEGTGRTLRPSDFNPINGPQNEPQDTEPTAIDTEGVRREMDEGEEEIDTTLEQRRQARQEAEEAQRQRNEEKLQRQKEESAERRREIEQARAEAKEQVAGGVDDISTTLQGVSFPVRRELAIQNRIRQGESRTQAESAVNDAGSGEIQEMAKNEVKIRRGFVDTVDTGTGTGTGTTGGGELIAVGGQVFDTSNMTNDQILALNQIKDQKSRISNEFTELNNELDSLLVNRTQQTESMIQNLKAQFAQRRRSVERANEASLEGLEQIGIRTGAQRRSASFGGIMSSEERAGIQRLNELDRQEQEAILAARQALTEDKFNIFQEKMDAVEAKREQIKENASALNKTVIERNEQIQAEKEAIEEENRVINLTNAAIENPEVLDNISEEDRTKVIGKMSEQGVSVQSLFADREAISGVLEEAAKNGAPDNVLDSIESATDHQEAIRAAGEFLVDPSEELDMALKKAQIQKTKAQTSKIINDVSKNSQPKTTEQEVKKAKSMLSVTKELRGHPALSQSVGAASNFPVVSFLQKALTPGSAAEFNVLLDNVVESFTLENLELMSGTLTDNDIEILRRAATRLSTDLSEDRFLQELNTIEGILVDRIEENGGVTNPSIVAPSLTQEEADELNTSSTITDVNNTTIPSSNVDKIDNLYGE